MTSTLMCCRRSAGDLVGPASCDVRPVSRCSLYCNFDRFGSSRLSCDIMRELLLVARHGPPPPAGRTARATTESTNPTNRRLTLQIIINRYQESSAVASARRVTRGRHADARTRAKCHASPEGGGGSPRPRRGRRRFAGAGDRIRVLLLERERPRPTPAPDRPPSARRRSRETLSYARAWGP